MENFWTIPRQPKPQGLCHPRTRRRAWEGGKDPALREYWLQRGGFKPEVTELPGIGEETFPPTVELGDSEVALRVEASPVEGHFCLVSRHYKRKRKRGDRKRGG